MSTETTASTVLAILPRLSQDRLATLIDMLPDDELDAMVLELAPRLDLDLLLGLIERVSVDALHQLDDAYGFRGCDCQLENDPHSLKNATPEERFVVAIRGPKCTHVLQPKRYLLPEAAYDALQRRLYPSTLDADGFDGMDDPIEPPAPFSVNEPTAIVAIMERRNEHGFHVHHRDDPTLLPEKLIREYDRKGSGNGSLRHKKVIDDGHAAATDTRAAQEPGEAGAVDRARQARGNDGDALPG